MGGLGQRGQPERVREPGVVGKRVDVVGAVPTRALGQQQRADRLPGGDRGGGRVAGLGDQIVQAQLGHRRKQQQQPGVAAADGRAGRPARLRPCLDRLQFRGAAAASVVAAVQPGQPGLVENLPHRLRRDRRALLGQHGGDLADAAPARPQCKHLLPHRGGGLARALRAGLGLGERRELAGAQQGGHLMHRSGGVAVPVGDLGGSGVLDEIGAQRLVAALARAAGLGELPPQPSTGFLEQHTHMLELYLCPVRAPRGARFLCCNELHACDP